MLVKMSLKRIGLKFRKFDEWFACDQLNSASHNALLEVSSSASGQHILTDRVYTQLYLH